MPETQAHLKNNLFILWTDNHKLLVNRTHNLIALSILKLPIQHKEPGPRPIIQDLFVQHLVRDVQFRIRFLNKRRHLKHLALRQYRHSVDCFNVHDCGGVLNQEISLAHLLNLRNRFLKEELGLPLVALNRYLAVEFKHEPVVVLQDVVPLQTAWLVEEVLEYLHFLVHP